MGGREGGEGERERERRRGEGEGEGEGERERGERERERYLRQDKGTCLSSLCLFSCSRKWLLVSMHVHTQHFDGISML